MLREQPGSSVWAGGVWMKAVTVKGLGVWSGRPWYQVKGVVRGNSQGVESQGCGRVDCYGGAQGVARRSLWRTKG